MKGWLYEQRGHDHFLDQFGPVRYIPSQWFQYEIRGEGLKFCQTDGLLFTPEQRHVLILEFKYKHTPDAFFQLEDKYVPVVRKIFRNWSISTVEVVKWFDPSTPFPVEVALKADITETLPNEFGVHINRFK